MSAQAITVETTVQAGLDRVWECWNLPEHIGGWAFASDDWGAEPKENDLRTGGAFRTAMFAKDGSASFDFEGTYTAVDAPVLVEFDLTDGRHVKVEFHQTPAGVHVRETFDPENENPLELQREGWQAFLENFKKYVEAN